MGSAEDLGKFLDDERSKLLDTVDWLLSLEEEDFRKEVAADIYKKTDDVTMRALRHPKLRPRWHHALGALRLDVKQQLKTVKPGDKADYAEWVGKATWFRTHIDITQRELDALRATSHGDTSKAAEANKLRRSAREEATGRLINAHLREFTLYLAEAEASRGVEMKDGLYRAVRKEADKADSEG
jgi:hypothetical protein